MAKYQYVVVGAVTNITSKNVCEMFPLKEIEEALTSTFNTTLEAGPFSPSYIIAHSVAEMKEKGSCFFLDHVGKDTSYPVYFFIESNDQLDMNDLLAAIHHTPCIEQFDVMHIQENTSVKHAFQMLALTAKENNLQTLENIAHVALQYIAISNQSLLNEHSILTH